MNRMSTRNRSRSRRYDEDLQRGRPPEAATPAARALVQSIPRSALFTAMTWLRCLAWLGLLLWLTGCASPPMPRLAADAPWNIPLPQRVLVAQTRPPSDAAPTAIAPLWLVVAQGDGRMLRWSRFDVLGVPDARQRLSPQGQWEPEGFLPPNPRARELFAALLFAWMREEDRAAAYGQNSWDSENTPDGGRILTYRERGHARWIVTWPDAAQRAVFSIQNLDGALWLVSPLPAEPAR